MTRKAVEASSAEEISQASHCFPNWHLSLIYPRDNISNCLDVRNPVMIIDCSESFMVFILWFYSCHFFSDSIDLSEQLMVSECLTSIVTLLLNVLCYGQSGHCLMNPWCRNFLLEGSSSSVKGESGQHIYYEITWRLSCQRTMGTREDFSCREFGEA